MCCLRFRRDNFVVDGRQMVSLISVHGRSSLSDVYGLLHFSLVPVGFTGQCIVVLSTVEGVYPVHRPGLPAHAVSPEQTDSHPTRLLQRQLSDRHDRQRLAMSVRLREHTQHPALRRQVSVSIPTVVVVPVVRGEGGHGYCHLFSSFLASSHFSITVFSITSLQLLPSFAFVLHSPPTLSRSLLTQSSHRILGVTRLLFPAIFCASVLFQTCHMIRITRIRYGFWPFF